jgi:hypothetical protein
MTKGAYCRGHSYSKGWHAAALEQIVPFIQD